MEKQRLFLIIAGAVLGVVAIFSINAFVTQQRKAIQEQARRELAEIRANQTAVLVAKESIPRGAVLKEDMLEASIVPNRYVQPQAVTSMDRVSGMVAAVPIAEGEQITMNRLVTGLQSAESLAAATPVNKRAVAIPVDEITSVGGLVRPGDYVDVIGVIPVPGKDAEGKDIIQSTTVPVFQNVLILAVGKNLDVNEPAVSSSSSSSSRSRRKSSAEEAPASSRSSANIITLALSPQEANFIAFMLEQGKVRLILRSPADPRVEPAQIASWDNLLRYVFPDLPKQQAPEKPKEKPTRPVEVYRGLNKEIVNLEVKE